MLYTIKVWIKKNGLKYKVMLLFLREDYPNFYSTATKGLKNQAKKTKQYSSSL